jgi:hypothetical protein
MRRPALYSSSRSGRVPEVSPAADAAPAAPAARTAHRFSASSARLLWAAIALLTLLLALSLALSLRPAPRKLTQADINAAVMKTMETQVMPSEYARAYEKISPSVVRVISYVNKSRLRPDRDMNSGRPGRRAWAPRPGTRTTTTTSSRAWAPAWSSSTRA